MNRQRLFQIVFDNIEFLFIAVILEIYVLKRVGLITPFDKWLNEDTVLFVLGILGAVLIARKILRYPRFFWRGDDRSEKSQSDVESLPAAERQTARSADSLVRQFQQRVQAEVDAAAKRLSSESDILIRQKIGEKIDSQLGTDLIGVLGEKLALQTNEASQLTSLRRDVSDQFIQMRNRALEYAGSAERQSNFFRRAGFIFAAIGLVTLAGVLIFTHVEYREVPGLLNQNMDWKVLVLRHGPSYGFVVLNEFLALIMFRYQSKSLEYMRFFSNEATNIDARNIGVRLGLKFLKKDEITKLIEKMTEKLISTERNFIIAKGQKTLETANNEGEDRLVERITGRISGAFGGLMGADDDGGSVKAHGAGARRKKQPQH